MQGFKNLVKGSKVEYEKSFDEKGRSIATNLNVLEIAKQNNKKI